MIKTSKKLIRERFANSIHTYEQNATVQKTMATKLVELILQQSKEFYSVFEIGSGSGLLTREIKEHLSFNEYWANDINEYSENFIKSIIEDTNFVEGDIEKLMIDNKFDLITSNATFQWIADIENISHKLSKKMNKDSILAFSTFGPKNYKEIKEITGVGLPYKSLDELNQIFNKNFDVITYEEESIRITFEKPIDILLHLKNTGTNSIESQKWTKKDLIEFCEKYSGICKADEHLHLTYNPIYMVMKKINN